MPTVTARFFQWAEAAARKNDNAVVLPLSPRNIATFDVQDKTLFVGNVDQIRNAFNGSCFAIFRQVLDKAGFHKSGVELDRRYAPAVSALFSEFLDKGHRDLPALGWVVPVTCSLAAHTGGEGPRHVDGTQFGIDPRNGKLFVPLGGAKAHHDFGVEIDTGDFPWVMPECSSLALIPRVYQGNGFIPWRRQYTIASFADSDRHRQFFRENDLVVAHEEAIVRGEAAHAWHSLNPLICCGRLRPYPNDLRAGQAFPYRSIFDYVALVLDARSRGIISLSYLSVDFEQWIKFWCDVGEAVRSIVAPDLIEPTEELAKAVVFERCRRTVLKEINGWSAVYKSSWDLQRGIERALQDILLKARTVPVLALVRNNYGSKRDWLQAFEELAWVIAHVEGFDNYEAAADGVLDVREAMLEWQAALGFALSD